MESLAEVVGERKKLNSLHAAQQISLDEATKKCLQHEKELSEAKAKINALEIEKNALAVLIKEGQATDTKDEGSYINILFDINILGLILLFNFKGSKSCYRRGRCQQVLAGKS